MWSVESDTDQILKSVLQHVPTVPDRITHLGNTEVQWWEGKPGDAVVMAKGGSPEDRWLGEQIVTAQLEAVGYKRAKFTFDSEHKTSGWADIMQKAKRLVQAGDVTLLRNGWNNIVAHVIGDHGEYTCEIGRDDPESRSITTWQCECPWDQYAWQRTRKWKKYEGRPCAHVLAAFWKSQATPLDEGPPEGQNLPPGQKAGPPPVAPGGGGGGAPAGPPLPSVPQPGEESVPQQRLFGPDEALGQSAPMGPPGQSGILPTPPMDQLAEQMPPVPGQTPGGVPANPNIVSVPGAKMPSPFNPIQFPGGTYSSKPPEPPDYRKGTDKEHCGNCKMNDNGHCWGYGNKEIRFNFVCDSWTAERVSKNSALDLSSYMPEIEKLAWEDTPDWKDWCVNACSRVSPYLRKQGIQHSVIDGDWAGSRHTWIQLRDGTILDPTITQFRGEGHPSFFGAHAPQSTSKTAVLPNGHPGQRYYNSENITKIATEEFVAPEIVRLKNDGYGIAEGKSEEHGAGQYQSIPAGSNGEVLGQDQNTGWVEVIFPLNESSYLEPYHVKMFCDPNELEHTDKAPPGPFIRRR